MQELARILDVYDFEYATLQDWRLEAEISELTLAISSPIRGWQWIRGIDRIKKYLGLSRKRTVMRRLEIVMNGASVSPMDPIDSLRKKGVRLPIEIETFELSAAPVNQLKMTLEQLLVSIVYDKASFTETVIEDAGIFDSKDT